MTAKSNILSNFRVINNSSFNVKLRNKGGSLTGKRSAQLALDFSNFVVVRDVNMKDTCALESFQIVGAPYLD